MNRFGRLLCLQNDENIGNIIFYIVLIYYTLIYIPRFNRQDRLYDICRVVVWLRTFFSRRVRRRGCCGHGGRRTAVPVLCDRWRPHRIVDLLLLLVYRLRCRHGRRYGSDACRRSGGRGRGRVRRWIGHVTRGALRHNDNGRQAKVYTDAPEKNQNTPPNEPTVTFEHERGTTVVFKYDNDMMLLFINTTTIITTASLSTTTTTMIMIIINIYIY